MYKNRIKARRELVCMTQKQLAEASGVNMRTIQKVENGECKAGNMTAKSILAIAKALGVDPYLLVEE